MSQTTSSYSEVVETAREYYNSDDAESFYSTIWGGEDIHIGLYGAGDDTIAAASRRSVERLAEQLQPLGPQTPVLDLGSGYGGTARFLAREYECPVVGWNLSEVENERARRLNEEQGLEQLVDIVDGSFESIDSEPASFAAVCSQDALLHSGEREQVVAEAARVLKPAGVLAFTDIMQADDCPDGVLQPILDRIHLSDLGSPEAYRQAAAIQGLEEEAFDDLTPHLTRHYVEVLAETERRETELREQISDDYLEHMKRGLARWIDGGEQGFLVWGMFTFRKADG